MQWKLKNVKRSFDWIDHATKPQIRGCHLNFGIPSTRKIKIIMYEAVLRIRIRRIHMFLGLLDLDPDPSIIKQKK
jgi:hypothetical protein